ncbi:MAG: helix-turn-helix transcriptional regulator [Polyangiaceae bacterium]|nr:helix-turn-helix transcriptional regulator [Polyangiaceae bacterium]MCB9606892.1 helix-turn-helix transcriptional regulator [Polyangiaceae bacterium]
MHSYGQYCPISRASEILAERWTLLILRNLLLGCTRFNDIASGLPGISRSLLVARLRTLEDKGVVVTSKIAGRRGKEYQLTKAGRALWHVIRPLAAWGERWIELQPQHTDPSFVLWAWTHVHLRRELLPKRRVVVEFDFPEQPLSYQRFWMLIERGAAELCYDHPGFDVDVSVWARSQAFTEWHIGRIEWGDALSAGYIRVEGPRQLARALPTWNARALPA